MRQVGGNTGGVDNIVEGELIDERGELQEQGQGLWRVDQHRRMTDDAVKGELHTCPIPPEAPATTVLISAHLPQGQSDSCQPTSLDHLDCFDKSQSGEVGESGESLGSALFVLQQVAVV